MAESVRASWAAAAILVGLLYVSDGATTGESFNIFCQSTGSSLFLSKRVEPCFFIHLQSV